MDAEMQRRIKETVVEILKAADMEETTEFKVRSLASEKLGIDLSFTDRKRFVRGVVESYLLSNEVDKAREAGQEAGKAVAADDAKELKKSGREEEEEEEEEEEKEEEEGRENKRSLGAREFDDEGNLVICRLSQKRKVTIQDFRGRTLVSVREYYDKGGKELPSHKGWIYTLISSVTVLYMISLGLQDPLALCIRHWYRVLPPLGHRLHPRFSMFAAKNRSWNALF